MMEDNPGKQVDQGYCAGKESHDDRDIQSCEGIDNQIIGQDPSETKEGTSTQKLNRSHSLSHQVIQALPVEQEMVTNE